MPTSKRPLTDKDGNVRTLESSDFKRGRKASEIFPESLKVQLGILRKPTLSPNATPFALRSAEAECDVGADGSFRKVGEKAARHFEQELISAAHSLVAAISA